MRYVVTHRSAAAAKGAAARALVTREFSLHAVALKVLAELLRLQDEVEELMSVPLPEGSLAAAVAAGATADAAVSAGGGGAYGAAITVPGDQASQQQSSESSQQQQQQQGQDYYRQGALAEQYQGQSQGSTSTGTQGSTGEAYGGSTLRGDPSGEGTAGNSRTGSSQQQQHQAAAAHGQHSGSGASWQKGSTVQERSWDLGVTKVVLSLAGEGQAMSLTDGGTTGTTNSKGASSGTAAARWSAVTGLLSRHRRHALTRKRDKKR
jgi:hypothetical protein